MKRLSIILLAAMAIVACKKQTVVGPEGPQGPQGPQGATGAQGPAGTSAKGAFYGKVSIIDPNNSTATLSLANTTISIPDQTLQTTTNANGQYTLSNVTAGMLDLNFTLTDGAVYKQQQIPYPGNNNVLMNQSISLKTTESVTGRFVDTIVGGEKGIYIYSKFNPIVTKARRLAVIFGTSNLVSPYDPNTFLYTTSLGASGANLKINFFVSYAEITSPYLFSAGQTVYVNAYPTPASTISYYDVYADQEVLYTAGSPIAATFSAVVK